MALERYVDRPGVHRGGGLVVSRGVV
jgi:hypothetical protein